MQRISIGSLLHILQVGNWSWLFYRKYWVPDAPGPESLRDAQTTTAASTAAYAVAVLPILRYYRLLDSTNTIFRQCKRAKGTCYSNTGAVSSSSSSSCSSSSSLGGMAAKEKGTRRAGGGGGGKGAYSYYVRETKGRKATKKGGGCGGYHVKIPIGKSS